MQLAITYRMEYVVWVTSAKRTETRDRRIEKTIAMLREGRQAP